MSLSKKLQRALDSRQERNILRRLPEPATSTGNHVDQSKRATPTQGLVDFCTNDYLSLASNETLRARFLEKLPKAPEILGSGGSRLLVNGSAHHNLEERLRSFFGAPAALLFNSGFDANVSFFSCVPQEGDVVIYDEFIHASIHDGVRSWSSKRGGSHFSFEHNSISSFRELLIRILKERPGLHSGENNAFIAVETLYSMDGTFAPLSAMISLAKILFPHNNCHFFVDEAHSTGVYGHMGKGLINYYGLEDQILVRLHTFGKALASSGAVLLTTQLIKNYLINYARPLIYTTSMSNASIIATDCSFDLLEDGTATMLAHDLKRIFKTCYEMLRDVLSRYPPDVVSMPSNMDVGDSDLVPHIIPVMTNQPRMLSSYLAQLGLNVRPISWPTVPKGKARVRVCLHASNTQPEIQRLVDGIAAWASTVTTNYNRGGHANEDRSTREIVVAKL